MQFPFDTPTEFIALALVLIAGWFLGLASRSGGRKWRLRAQEAERERDEARRRIATLENENAELNRRTVAERPVAPAADTSRGWFGWGRDNLARIRGVGEPGERLLHEHGIKTYRAVETLTPEEEAALEQRMGLTPGTIAREGWREQAAMLRSGDDDAHAKRFG